MDDAIPITDNIKWLSSIENIFITFSTEYLPNLYRPVLIISFIIDTIIGDGNPIIYHLTNILLHIISTCLLYTLLMHISKNQFVNILSSLLFSVHPIFVHAVVWIPGRNDILLAIFLLISTISLYKYLRINNVIQLLLHLGCFTIALFTKEIAMVYPIIIMIITNSFDFNKLKSARFIIPHLLIILTWIFLRISLSTHILQWANDNFLISLFYTFNHFVISIGKMTLPISQSIIPHYTNLDFKYLFVFVILLITLLNFKKSINKLIFPWIYWPILFIIPTITWSVFGIGDNIFYEHRLYTSVIGIIILFTLLIGDKILSRLRIVKYMYILLFIYFTQTSWVRIGQYNFPTNFSNNAVEESPKCYKSYVIRGSYYYEIMEYDKALKDLNIAIDLNSKLYKIYNRIGTIYQYNANFNLALLYYDKTLQLMPDYYETIYNKGNIYLKEKNYKLAAEFYKKIISTNNEFIPAFNNLALVYYYQADYVMALKILKRVIKSGQFYNLQFYYSLIGK